MPCHIDPAQLPFQVLLLPQLLILALPLRAQGTSCVSEPRWVGEAGIRRRSRLLLFDYKSRFL